jgi:hypothetical protein
LPGRSWGSRIPASASAVTTGRREHEDAAVDGVEYEARAPGI